MDGGMIPAWDVIAVSKQRPICSRRRHPESRPHRSAKNLQHSAQVFEIISQRNTL
jgi:hypothetical protein